MQLNDQFFKKENFVFKGSEHLKTCLNFCFNFVLFRVILHVFLTGVIDPLSYNFFAVKYKRYFINENSLFSVQNIEMTIKTNVPVIFGIERTF